jgi:hypothetical protein
VRRFLLTSIPHQRQAYPTVGNYVDGHGFTLITVSDVANEDYEVLVAVHELIEYLLCKKRGIKLADIDAFDMAFEDQRVKGLVDGEPGDAPDAPYRKEHRFAENIERQLAYELGVDWADYERTLGAL